MSGPQKHVWLTPEFSVRQETLCFREKTKLAPGVTDYRNGKRVVTGEFCCQGRGHTGRCVFIVPDVRLYSFKERDACE